MPELASYDDGSGPGDFGHGVMKAQAEDAGEQIDGIARHVVIGPAPVAVLEDETGAVGQFEVAGPAVDEEEAATTQDGFEGREAGVADLFARPTRLAPAGFRGVGCHVLFSSGVG